MSETVLVNDVTSYGLRRLHVLSERRLERERWLAEIPWEARDPEGRPSVAVWEREEAVIGAWHTWFVWHARGDVVEVKTLTPALTPTLYPTGTMSQRERGMKGIMWYVEHGERMGDVIGAAAWRYLALFEQWADTVLVHKLGEGAPEAVMVDDHRLVLAVCEWVPKRCVFVTIGGMQHGS